MQIIVGLGNPGAQYARTRHNTGFLAIDTLKIQIRSTKSKILNNFSISKSKLSVNKQKNNNNGWNESRSGKLQYIWLKIRNEDIELVKPLTFMNRSGEALSYIKKKHPNLTFTNLWIVHDDLDLQLGEFKIQFGKGPRQHGGINSIEQHLKTKDFWRVRIGVRGEWYDRIKASTDKTIAEDYLLKPFGQMEKPILSRAIEEAVIKLVQIITKTDSGQG